MAQPTESVHVELAYGSAELFSCDVDAERVILQPQPRIEPIDLVPRLPHQLQAPQDCPPLAEFVLDSDSVVLAADYDVPQLELVVAAMWEQFEQRNLPPEQLLILQPIHPDLAPLKDPRCMLPDGARDAVRWTIHDPSERNRCAYLAATSSGDRIYLARELINADVVFSVGRTAFDQVLGYRGTGSVFYPGLADVDACKRACGQGHSELDPDNDRPLRQIVDEITWLLGTILTVQVVPANGGGVAEVFVGSIDSAGRDSRLKHAALWKIPAPERSDVVVVAIDADPTGDSWTQLGAALDVARSLVAPQGRIVVLSSIQGAPGPGINMLRNSPEPSEAIKPLRLERPSDIIAATQLARAVDWANVYLLSQLDPDLLEDLFIVPLSDIGEVSRLLDGHSTCSFVGSAHNCYAHIEA